MLKKGYETLRRKVDHMQKKSAGSAETTTSAYVIVCACVRFKGLKMKGNVRILRTGNERIVKNDKLCSE